MTLREENLETINVEGADPLLKGKGSFSYRERSKIKKISPPTPIKSACKQKADRARGEAAEEVGSEVGSAAASAPARR